MNRFLTDITTSKSQQTERSSLAQKQQHRQPRFNAPESSLSNLSSNGPRATTTSDSVTHVHVMADTNAISDNTRAFLLPLDHYHSSPFHFHPLGFFYSQYGSHGLHLRGPPRSPAEVHDRIGCHICYIDQCLGRGSVRPLCPGQTSCR